MRLILTEQEKNHILNLYEQFDKQKISDELRKVKTYYINLYQSPETASKFKNKSNLQKLLNQIPKIKVKIWTEKNSPRKSAFGWANKNFFDIVNLNLWKLTSGTMLYDTILHETGHLLDFFMRSLGEDTITTSTTGYYSPTGSSSDSYVANEYETFTRIQRLRSVFGIGPKDSLDLFVNKIIQDIKSRKLTFDNYRIFISPDNSFLSFKKPDTDKGILSDLWSFFSVAKYNGTKISDIAALFALFSKIENGVVRTNLKKIAELNFNTKEIN